MVNAPAVMKRTLFSLFVVALASQLFSGCYTNPVTGRKSLVVIPADQELALGAQSFSDIRSKEKVSTQTNYNTRVTRVGQRIAQAVGNEMPNAKWEFVVFESDQ